QLAYWPEVVEDATGLMEPHRIPYYVHDLSTAVHRFYHAGNEEGEHRVVVDDPLLTRARLELCRAARHTLKTALDLIGVSAPERMQRSYERERGVPSHRAALPRCSPFRARMGLIQCNA